MLEVKNLRKRFDNFEVLKGFDFTLKEGEILGFLGPNGAGKTTTIRVLLGILKPDSGEFLLDGFTVKPEDPKFRSNFGILLEDTGLYERLNAYENLYFTGELWNMDKKNMNKRIDELFELLEIKEYAKKPVKTYSKGMKQRVAFARALLPDARFLILDEATAGIDIPTKVVIKEILKKERKRGKGILYSTHILEEVEDICDRVFVISNGERKFYGEVKEMTKGKDIEKSFMELLK